MAFGARHQVAASGGLSNLVPGSKWRELGGLIAICDRLALLMELVGGVLQNAALEWALMVA